METKSKPCKGINKAFGYDGCGKESAFRKYGLCSACFFDWMTETENGKIYKAKIFDKKVESKVKSTRRAETLQKKRELDTGSTMSLADNYFSRYIRVLFSDENGKCTCYTCGSINDIKEVDNGHYMKREHKSTRYHENNCRPQCKTCNGDTKHNGKQADFRVNLANEIGEDNVIKVEKLSRASIKANYRFFKDIADYYREKVNKLQKERKVKYW